VLQTALTSPQPILFSYGTQNTPQDIMIRE
jgi:hypothetical protein